MSSAKKIVVVLAWSTFSFICHYFAKEFMTEVALSVPVSHFVVSVLLSIGQVSTCTTFIYPNLPDHKPSTNRFVWMALACHFGATLATNYSFGKMYASICLTVKLGEPIFAAIILKFTSEGHKLTFMTVTALVLVVHGSIKFTGSTFVFDVTESGMHLAFISNILLAIRNVLIKEALASCTLQLKHNQPKTVLLYIAVVFMIVLVDKMTCPAGDCIQIITWYVTSCVSHAIYTYISLSLVLEYLGVVGHSVANVFKRLSVITMMIIVEKRKLSLDMCLGLLEATIGLIVYIVHRIVNKPSRINGKQVDFVRLLVFLLISLTALGLIAISDNSKQRHTNTSTDKSTNSYHHYYSYRDVNVDKFRQIIGERKNVTLVGFMSKKQPREYSMTYLGLEQILTDIKVSYKRCVNIEICTKELESDNNSVIILQSGIQMLTSPQLRKRTVIYFPEMKLDDRFREALQMGKYKDLSLFMITHTRVAKDYYSQVHDHVILVPHLGFYMKTAQRFMSPTTDVVALQHKTSGNLCDSLEIHCDSRDWDLNWYTPNYNDEAVDHVNQAWFGFMYILRGKIVYTEKLGGLVAAVLYDVPCFVGTDLAHYVDTWTTSHLQASRVYVTTNISSAATYMTEYLSKHEDLPQLWDVLDALK